MLPDYIETDHLKVIRLWDIDGFQGNGRQDQMGALRYPSLGCPVEGGPLHPRLLQLWVTWRVQIHLRQLECDSSGSLVKAAKRSGHPAIDIEC